MRRRKCLRRLEILFERQTSPPTPFGVVGVFRTHRRTKILNQFFME
jgi:hypothetical protein